MRKGPILMVAAGAMFTAMVAMARVARQELSPLDVILWRGVTALPLALLLTRGRLALHARRLFALRAVLGFVAMIGFFTAARGLAVADLSLISKLQPILVALIAPLALGAGERPGAAVWVTLVAGLVGCGLILAPGLAVGSTYGLWCAGATVFSAGAHVCVRGLARTDDPRVLVLYFQLAVAVLALLGLVIFAGGPAIPPTHLIPWLLGLGVAATAGQLLMTMAYREDRAPVVAAASYSAPLWGLCADLAVFGLLPTWQALAGGGLIVGAGLLLIVRR